MVDLSMSSGKKNLYLVLGVLVFLLSVASYLGYKYYFQKSFPEEGKESSQEVQDAGINYQPLYAKSGARIPMGMLPKQQIKEYKTVEISGVLKEIRKEGDNLLGVIVISPNVLTSRDIPFSSITVFLGSLEDKVAVYEAIGFKEDETRNWQVKTIKEVELLLQENTQVVVEVYSFILTQLQDYCQKEQMVKICENYQKYLSGNAKINEMVFSDKNDIAGGDITVGPAVSMIFGTK